jgi:tetratricopeptide (TPR) repeat protein
MGQAADFFVSYTSTDRAWAEWIAWQLEADGYQVVIQAWDFRPGSDFLQQMHQVVQKAKRTIAVLSPAYLTSAFGGAEWRAVFAEDPSGERGLLLPVRVEEVNLPGLLTTRIYVDLVGKSTEDARAALVAAARDARGKPAVEPQFPGAQRRSIDGASTAPRFPGALPPVWNLPFHRNPAFTGRDDELARLAASLQMDRTVAVTQVLQGGGGVGKTTLAVEYAYRQRALFDAVWWVRAEEPATLLGDYAELGVACNVAEAGEPDRQLAAIAVRRWLEDHDRWLLVLDNAEAPDASIGLEAPLDRVVGLLPQVVHGQVLVTTRDTSWEEHAAVAELEVFSPDEAVAFLLTRSNSTDERAAAMVAELLGWLPLALEQAGAYVRETRLPLSAYLDRLRQFPAMTLTRGRPRDRDPADTVATTWLVSLDRVQPIPGAVALLELCAFLGAEEIPREVFTQRLDLEAEDLSVLADDPFALDEAVATIRRYGLAKVTEDTFLMHRLLQQVIRDRLPPNRRISRTAAAVRLLRMAFPTETTNPDAWPTYARLLPHALAVTGHAESLDVEPEETTWLLNEVGLYLWQRADHQQAQTLLERALAIREAHLGPDHPDTAQSLNNLALVLHDQGRYNEARTFHERALAIREAHLGPDHPDTAQSLNNLGKMLRDQGDLDRARTLLERALAIREVRLGNHQDTAWSLNNLALVLHDQGDLDRACILYERALALFELHLGDNHPDTAHAVSRLATSLDLRGDIDRALILHERSLAIREARRGPDHPDTAHSLNNFGRALSAQGDLKRARILLERALAIRETRLGEDHHLTAHTLNDLARVLKSQGDLDGARGLLDRALAIYEVRLDADHPDTAQSLHDLGVILAKQGDLDGARTLLQRALLIRQSRLGPDHPDTLSSKNDLAAVRQELGEL